MTWSVASFCELSLARYLARCVALLSRLIHSRDSYDPKLLPEYIVMQGTYKNRDAVIRLNITTLGVWRRRIDAHVFLKPRDLALMAHPDLVPYKATSAAISWSFGFSGPDSPEREIQALLDELSQAADSIESRFRTNS